MLQLVAALADCDTVGLHQSESRLDGDSHLVVDLLRWMLVTQLTLTPVSCQYSLPQLLVVLRQQQGFPELIPLAKELLASDLVSVPHHQQVTHRVDNRRRLFAAYRYTDLYTFDVYH